VTRDGVSSDLRRLINEGDQVREMSLIRLQSSLFYLIQNVSPVSAILIQTVSPVNKVLIHTVCLVTNS
jgi:hypothetical protein